MTEKVWNPGDTIRIKFLPGGSYSPELENQVKQSEAAMNEFVENLPIANDGYISINIDPSFDISITIKLTDKG